MLQRTLPRLAVWPAARQHVQIWRHAAACTHHASHCTPTRPAPHAAPHAITRHPTSPEQRPFSSCSSTSKPNGPTSTTGVTSGEVPWLCALERWPAAPHESSNGAPTTSTGAEQPSTTPHSNSSNNLWNNLPSDLDAVIILAGGLNTDGGAPPWVERRLATAAGIWAAQAATGRSCPILCLGGGTPHKPPIITEDGYVMHESTSCALHLMDKWGVPTTDILKEVSSYDTVGNAYFALTIHAIPAGWRNVAVVTSDFHMPRTKSLFIEMWSRAAKDVWREPGRYTFWFASSTDEGLWSDDVLAARAAKEQSSLATWQRTAEGLPTMKALHAWLYATHQCYSVNRQHETNRVTITDKRLLESY